MLDAIYIDCDEKYNERTFNKTFLQFNHYIIKELCAGLQFRLSTKSSLGKTWKKCFIHCIFKMNHRRIIDTVNANYLLNIKKLKLEREVMIILIRIIYRHLLFCE